MPTLYLTDKIEVGKTSSQMRLNTKPLVHGQLCNVFKKDNESIKNNGNAEKGHKVSPSQWKQLVNAVKGA